MTLNILILDRVGVYPSFISELESQLGCGVGAFKELRLARDYLGTHSVNLAVVNPYEDQVGLIEAYVNFVKTDLKQKETPVLIFSRTAVPKITKMTGLILGVDYAAYLKKPASAEDFVKCVRELLED